MTKLSPSLRKAAVLISALDEGTAEALLAHMGSEQAAKVRSTLVELDDIQPEEQQEVLAEFLGRRNAPTVKPASGDEVSLELDPLVEAEAETHASAPLAMEQTTSPLVSGEAPLAFLQHVAPHALADHLCREQPQTVAVVVGRLPAEQAAAVLERLPARLATETLERMAWLDEVSPEVEQDLARQLRQQLAPQLAEPDSKPFSVGRLNAVLAAMDFRQRQRVVMQLGRRNAGLLRQLGLYSDAAKGAGGGDREVVAFRYRLAADRAVTPPSRLPRTSSAAADALLTFDDLALLNDQGLRAVFAAVHPQVVLLALTGAEPRLLSRIFGQLPAQEAAVLQRRLEHPGPVRLRDIEQAQQELATVASRLAREEAIQLPASIRFAAAA